MEASKNRIKNRIKENITTHRVAKKKKELNYRLQMITY